MRNTKVNPFLNFLSNFIRFQIIHIQNIYILFSYKPVSF